MQNLRPSETALKIAYGVLSLSAKPGWSKKLPPELPGLIETLILEAKVMGYGKRLVAASQKKWMVSSYNVFEKIVPGIFEGMGYRKLFVSWAVENAITDGANQVLIVGAGFDALCLQLAPKYPDVEFFEVDHPATAIAKARGVAKVGQPDNLTLLQADLGEVALSDVLADCSRWDAAKRSVSVAEGLLYYLRQDQVQELFGHLHQSSGEGSRVAFCYMQDHRKYGWMGAALNALREPWLSSSPKDQLDSYIGEGWRVFPEPNPTDYGSDLEEFALAERV